MKKYKEISPGVFRDPDMQCISAATGLTFTHGDIEHCGTGCRDPKHMAKCVKCGAEYHIGTIHHCPTSVTPIEELTDYES